MKYFTTIAGILTLLLLAACSSLEQRSQKLELGMTKETVIDTLGTDYSVAAARVEIDGSPVAVLKYRHKKETPIYLYFRNDKLVQWGDTQVLKAMPPAAVE